MQIPGERWLAGTGFLGAASCLALSVTIRDPLLAMLVMGLASDNPVRIDDSAFIATSFPGFVELMRSLGADLS